MLRRYSLQASMGGIILVFIIALSIAVTGLTQASSQINEIANKEIEILQVAQNIQFEDLTLTDAVRGIIIAPLDTHNLEVYNTYAEKIDSSIKRMKVLDPTSKKTFDQIDAINVRLMELETEIMEKAAISPQEALAIYKGEYTDLRGQLQGTMGKFVADKKQSVVNNAKQGGQDSTTMRNIAVIVGIMSIIICIFVCAKFLKAILNPVRLLAQEAALIASGDLTAKEIKVNTKNEVGQLAEAFNTMFHYLKDIINQLNEKSQVVAASATQLTASAENVSAGANETASSIHEVAATVDQVTQNTQKIAEASSQADAFAKEGNDGIEEVTLQMEAIKKATTSVGQVIRELNESNMKISQIVNLITQIADQTNLLALNAAIEAARAGEQGRGFAVVAEEVKKLAEQSADAAKEIHSLINTIQKESEKAVSSMDEGAKEVEYGTKIVSDVGETFGKITSTVQKLVVDIQDIASAAVQMSEGVQNVAAATEEQTATMEEVSATTQDLASLAGELEDLARRFKLV